MLEKSTTYHRRVEKCKECAGLGEIEVAHIGPFPVVLVKEDYLRDTVVVTKESWHRVERQITEAISPAVLAKAEAMGRLTLKRAVAEARQREDALIGGVIVGYAALVALVILAVWIALVI